MFRPVKNLKKIVGKRKHVKKKLKKAKKHNLVSTTRETTRVSNGWFGKKTVDAEIYFQDQIEKLDVEIKQIQSSSKKKNLGFAFISFKNKDCVYETIDEIDLVK